MLLPSPPLAHPAAQPPDARLTVVTLNLWGEQGPFEQRFPLCIAGLLALDPDLIALQEVRQIPGRLQNTAEQIARALGRHVVFGPATEWGGGVEGLALVCRFPLANTEVLTLPHARPDEHRILLLAQAMTPAGLVLCATTHLHYRMTDGVAREEQVAAVDRLLTERVQALRQSHPDTFLFAVWAGDLNATPDSDEVRFLRGLHTLAGRRTFYQDAFLCATHRPSDPGFTWSERNLFTHKLLFLERDRRLDYIFVSPPNRRGRGLVHSCRLVLDEPGPDGIFPSDHFGVLAQIELHETTA